MPLRLPQARDLDKLRRLLELLAGHDTDLDAIGTAMGAGKAHARRHASYYREAAEILGMIEPGALTVTARGMALLDGLPGGDREREVLRAAIADAEELGCMREALLSKEDPDTVALVSSMALELADLASATIERRVKDTLSWRRRVCAASAVTERAAQYDLFDPAVESNDAVRARLEHEPDCDVQGLSPVVLTEKHVDAPPTPESYRVAHIEPVDAPVEHGREASTRASRGARPAHGGPRGELDGGKEVPRSRRKPGDVDAGRNANVTLDALVSHQLGPTLRAFLEGWQPRQRRTLGLLNALLVRLNAVGNAHPEWADYDLPTHLLAALHLIIESDRLTGGHTEEQIVDELVSLVSFEQPADDPATHRAIAEAVVDVLTNARDRRLRLRDRYMRVGNARVEHREQTFAFVRAVGDEETTEPTLRATPEAINVFQNLYEFDPSDRAAAERYRSGRMLQRQEYNEVLTSVDRRATSVHGLRGELEGLVRRIGYNVRDVDYAEEVIPRLDEVIGTVAEQVNAEERFAEAVADLAHHAAPDLPRLRSISTGLRGLIGALGELQSTALTTRRSFESEQDRQLFTYRRITINPQAQLLEPLLDLSPEAALDVVQNPLAVWLGPTCPRVLHLGELVARSTPGERKTGDRDPSDPFELGPRRGGDDFLSPALLAAVTELLAEVQVPTHLSALLAAAAARVGDELELVDRLPWALAVTVASAYGHTGSSSDERSMTAGFDHRRLTVIASGEWLPNDARVGGDDLVVMPRGTRGTS